MVDVDQNFGLLFKKNRFQSSAMDRTSEWIFSQEIESDITIRAGGASFSLHRYPLVSKCGYIRKLVDEAEDRGLSLVEIPDVPGDAAEAFELAVKFCYGIDFEMDTFNIAALRCVAEHLEMTEDYAAGNLVSRTEEYLKEAVLPNLQSAITVLHRSESLLPLSEKVNLVGRCIDAVASIASSESQFSSASRDGNGRDGYSSPLPAQPKGGIGWWAEDLTVLRIDTFQRVVKTMKAKGCRVSALATLLMLYAQKSLRGLDIHGRGRKKLEPRKEHEKRVVLETIVGLLPMEKNAMSVSFLAVLLRAAVYLETSVACRLDLEKRIGLQLGLAVLDDLLIPSFSFSGDTVFDVDSVQRILVNYLEEGDAVRMGYGYGADDNGWAALRSPTDMERVGKLMESYLAEISSDKNLGVARFVGLAELIPEQARVTEDGMYRAIDIYLKAHPHLSDAERKKVCSVMDCQRLSREACAHAAQNDRLPVQIVVQVLYYEQQRLRDAVSGRPHTGGGASPLPQHRVPVSPRLRSPENELARLRQENDDLKVELGRMKMQMKQADKSWQGGQTQIQKGQGLLPARAEKPPLPKKSIINSVSKTLGKLNPFLHLDAIRSPKVRSRPAKDRRHSIS